MGKKNFLIILVVLLTLVVLAIVIWVFDKRIKNIDGKLKAPVTYTSELN